MLFYGGILRFSTPIMVMSFVTYSMDQTAFAGWQGLSYSSSHAFRDMVGYIFHTGTIYDMFSLLADTPYDDTSTNINGINDFTLAYSSGFLGRDNITFIYETQIYRFYET